MSTATPLHWRDRLANYLKQCGRRSTSPLDLTARQRRRFHKKLKVQARK